MFAACDLAMQGAVQAIVTAPLNKAAMHLAGFNYAGTPNCWQSAAMRAGAHVLVAPQLRVIHVSTHVSLQEGIQRVTTERVQETILQAVKPDRRWASPIRAWQWRGLNPHCR